MAENPIRKEDIIDIDGVSVGLQGLIKLLNVVVSLMDDIKKSTTDMVPSIQSFNAATAEGRKNIEASTKELQERKQSLTELEKLEKRLSATLKDTAQKEADYKRMLAENNKELKRTSEYNAAAEGSLKRLRIELERAKEQYTKATPEIAQKMVPAIQKLTNEVTKAEKAIGVHQRGVGNYKNSVVDAAKEIGLFAGGIGLAVGALGKLKEAFTQTETGLNFMTRLKESSKAFFQTLIETGNAQLAGANAVAAFKIAKQINEIRIGDRKDLAIIAQLETDIAKLRYEAADATLSESQQLDALNKALAKEDELIEFKKADIREERDALLSLLPTQMDNYELQNKIAELDAELIRLDGERNLRLMSRASALRNKMPDEKAELQNLEYEIDLKNTLLEIDAQIVALDQQIRDEQAAGIDFDKKTQEERLNALRERERVHREVTDREAENERRLAQTKEEQWRGIVNVVSDSTVAIANILEANKQRELSAAGDNAKLREKIEREYSRKQQTLSIGQAIINGAVGITEIWKKWAANPILAGIFTAAISAVTATQIALISSQKFAEGGYTGDGDFKDDTGQRVAGVVHEKEYVIPRGPTQKYRGLLEAIHKDNPMAIAEELRNRQFHMVWGGVQPKLIEASRQDPYTKMMYELLKNSVVTYQDSNGDTVLRFADGSTRVVRAKA